MNYATGLFSSVITLYSDINPSTLSGANDVIVVDNDGEYKCTPFEIRFGKLDMFRITSRTIYLIVNGKLCDLSMTIGPNGDIFFLNSHSELKINCYEEAEEEMSFSDCETTKRNRKGKNLSWEKEFENLENIFLANFSIKKDKLYSSFFIEKERKKNEEKRKYFFKKLNFPDLTKKYSTFRKLINSYEYFSYLISNIKLLYHVLRGNWLFPGQKIGACEIKGCKKSKIRFSLCGEQKAPSPLHEVFDKYEIVNLRDLDKLIVQITDCKKNHFYFEYSFFSEIFFLVRNEIYKNSQQNIENYKKSTKKSSNFCFGDLNPFLRYEIKNVLGLDNNDLESFDDERIVKLLEDLKSVSSEKEKPVRVISDEVKNRIKMQFGISSEKNEEEEKLDFEILRRGLTELTNILEQRQEKTVKWSFFKRSPKKKISWSTQLTSDELKRLHLKEGKNDIVFKVSGRDIKLEAKIFFWNKNSKIIISDIDGTITKSDLKGHLYALVGSDWTHVGVAQFYTKLSENGYKFIYLTSRPLGQSKMTRYYLNSINQNGYNLPDGPVIHSTSGLLGAIYRELILRSPEKFKIACLKKIREAFCGKTPFIAGFGNKPSDVITYKTLKIQSAKIFIINPDGSVSLDIAKGLRGTHFSLNAFVNCMFPKVKDDFDFDNSFNEIQFWKLPYNL